MGGGGEPLQGIPLGNYTSQFFASVYLGRCGHVVKHSLKAKYYVRYVDDFIILHNSKKQLEIWKEKIDEFLRNKLKLKLHQQKTKIFSLTKGIDFVGFRNFTHHKLLRKRNVKTMRNKIRHFEEGAIDFRYLAESYQGWQAYANWADTYNLRRNTKRKIIDTLWKKA